MYLLTSTPDTAVHKIEWQYYDLSERPQNKLKYIKVVYRIESDIPVKLEKS